jgi:hypothetical protein
MLYVNIMFISGVSIAVVVGLCVRLQRRARRRSQSLLPVLHMHRKNTLSEKGMMNLLCQE